MKTLAKILFLISLAGCITPQKASEKCNNWAQKWPRYFNRDTVIQITRPGTRQAQTFKATPDTNVIRWGNSSLLYRTAPGTPPECDTVKIESVYRTKPDTVRQKVQIIKYKERQKPKPKWTQKASYIIIGTFIGLILFTVIKKAA
jgi:hypothetical protein